MMKTPTMLVALFLTACGSSSTPAPAPPSSTATTVVEPAQPPAVFDPSGSYVTGGDCLSGTPENPTCIARLELAPDGTGSYVGDDTVEDLRWTRRADRVIVTLANWSMELRRNPDETLTGARGVIWTRSASR
jgi:hypothetical protein